MRLGIAILKTEITGRMSDGHLSFSDASGRMSGTGHLHPTSVPTSDFFWILMYDTNFYNISMIFRIELIQFDSVRYQVIFFKQVT